MMSQMLLTNFNRDIPLNSVAEFNVTFPIPARTDKAPNTKLVPTIRFVKEFTSNSDVYYLTKVDLALKIKYVDITNRKQIFVVHSNSISFITRNPITIDNIGISPVLEVLIPPFDCKVTEYTLDSTPTTKTMATNRGYFVYALTPDVVI